MTLERLSPASGRRAPGASLQPADFAFGRYSVLGVGPGVDVKPVFSPIINPFLLKNGDTTLELPPGRYWGSIGGQTHATNNPYTFTARSVPYSAELFSFTGEPVPNEDLVLAKFSIEASVTQDFECLISSDPAPPTMFEWFLYVMKVG